MRSDFYVSFGQTSILNMMLYQNHFPDLQVYGTLLKYFNVIFIITKQAKQIKIWYISNIKRILFFICHYSTNSDGYPILQKYYHTYYIIAGHFPAVRYQGEVTIPEVIRWFKYFFTLFGTFRRVTQILYTESQSEQLNKIIIVSLFIG